MPFKFPPQIEYWVYIQPTILKNIPRLFLQELVNLKVKQVLIGYIVWFSQSEVVLLSNASKSEDMEKKGQESS